MPLIAGAARKLASHVGVRRSFPQRQVGFCIAAPRRRGLGRESYERAARVRCFLPFINHYLGSLGHILGSLVSTALPAPEARFPEGG